MLNINPCKLIFSSFLQTSFQNPYYLLFTESKNISLSLYSLIQTYMLVAVTLNEQQFPESEGSKAFDSWTKARKRDVNSDERVDEKVGTSGCLKLAFVAIRNSHSKRRRLCVVVAVSRRGFVAGSRLPPRRLLACPVAFVAVNNIHPWIIVGQSTGESIVPVSLPPPPLSPFFLPPFITYSRDNFKCQLVLVERNFFLFFLLAFFSSSISRDNRIYFFDSGMRTSGKLSSERGALTGRKIALILKFILELHQPWKLGIRSSLCLLSVIKIVMILKMYFF